MKYAFDSCATRYDKLHKKSLGVLAGDMMFFSRHKVAHVKKNTFACPVNILDFGCGVGNGTVEMCRCFPEANVVGVDVSSDSIRIAKEKNEKINYIAVKSPGDLEQFAGTMDIVFVSNVFHHIPQEEHQEWLKALRGVLSVGGRLHLFEHNPSNVLTRLVVSRCSFDKDAVLLPLSYAISMFRDAGYDVIKSRYIYPVSVSSMITDLFDVAMASVPLGLQYYIVATRV